MEKRTIAKIAVGATVVTAVAVAGTLLVSKIVKEIRGDLNEVTFTSPNGDNTVKLSYGASKTAKNLTFVKVNACSESRDENSKFVVFSQKKPNFLRGEWIGNDRFKLLVGTGARKQCCDVCFDADQTNTRYYIAKQS